MRGSHGLTLLRRRSRSLATSEGFSQSALRKDERIAAEANADPAVSLVDRVEEDRRVAEALALMWRTRLGSSPLYYPPLDLVAAVEAQTGTPVWS
jgi:hypothetical protein